MWWFGIMPEMAFDVKWCNVKCGGRNDVMQWRCVIHQFHIWPLQFNIISHRTTFPGYNTTSPYHTSHIHSIPPLSSHITWRCGIVRCGMFCNASCGMLCLIHRLMWPWCGIRCDVEYGVMLHVMSCNVRRSVVKCGDAMWNYGVVHVEYGGMLMQNVKHGLWNTEWCGMVWCYITGCETVENAVWNVCCVDSDA